MKEVKQEVKTGSGIATKKERARKAYKKPKLTVYGKVADLTAGVGGSNADPGQQVQTKKGGG
jgi:hypothetical protein